MLKFEKSKIALTLLFLGAKAPLGLAHVTVTVTVKPKKLKNSMILPKLLDDG